VGLLVNATALDDEVANDVEQDIDICVPSDPLLSLQRDTIFLKFPV
jgi:hypothetical protein